MKVYIAGPDCFRQDPRAEYNRKTRVLYQLGFDGLVPIDNDVSNVPPDSQALVIYQANIEMINKCDAVIAEITPFRGPGMDAGTAFEIGFARAIGKTVYLYSSDDSEYKKRVEEYVQANQGVEELYPEFTAFPQIENFGLTENLMICAGRPVYSTFREAAQALALAVQAPQSAPASSASHQCDDPDCIGSKESA